MSSSDSINTYSLIRALAREDAIVNNEPPLADLAIDTWRRQCDAETRATIWVHGEIVKTTEVVGTIDALGRAQAAELYSKEWALIAAERSKLTAYDISQEIDTLRRRLMEAPAFKQARLVARIDHLTDALTQLPKGTPR